MRPVLIRDLRTCELYVLHLLMAPSVVHVLEQQPQKYSATSTQLPTPNTPDFESAPKSLSIRLCEGICCAGMHEAVALPNMRQAVRYLIVIEGATPVSMSLPIPSLYTLTHSQPQPSTHQPPPAAPPNPP